MPTKAKTKELTDHVDAMKAAVDKDVRVTETIEVGQCVHQGDVYIHRVAEDHPCGGKLKTRQLAPGDTQGSRHTVDGKSVELYAGVKLPDFVNFNDSATNQACTGPVIIAKAPFKVPHPEHPEHCLPAGRYQVTYQADLVRQARVAD